jgi:uncharacterized protein involved in exopolysaccharide biosynthesis
LLSAAGTEVNLRLLFAKMASERWLILLTVVVCTAAFGAYAFLATPVYRASMVLMPSTADRNSLTGSLNSALGQAGGLISLLGVGSGSSDSRTEEALAVLRSREFSERFISENGLLPKLFPTRWDSAKQQWKPSSKVPTLAKGFRYFDKNIRTIDHDKKTGLVVLQVDWKDRNEASSWANEMIRQLNAEMRNRAIAKSDASVKFLEKELTITNVVETREAVDRLIEAQEKQRMIANVTYDFAFGVVDKAMPADEDDPIKPKKALLIGLGLFLGIVLSFAAISVKTALWPGG